MKNQQDLLGFILFVIAYKWYKNRKPSITSTLYLDLSFVLGYFSGKLIRKLVK